MARLEGKVALITGAGRGLGLAMARRYREEGAEVWINDLRQESAEKAANEVGGRAVAADVADSAAVARMLETVKEGSGRLDVLVNNAGINGLEHDPELEARYRERQLAQVAEASAGGPIRSHLDFTLETSDEDWQRVIDIHLNGTFYCTREALRIMSPQNSGVILNLGSIMGTAGGAGGAAYCAAKAGILGFTRSMARELASRNIRVNAIAPGWIETDMTTFLGEMRPVLEAQTPLGRMGDVDDIAWAAVYLASDEAKFVTGQVLSPNGGWHMSQ